LPADYGRAAGGVTAPRYEARGREDGHDREDWFEAERELQQGVSPDSTTGRGEDVNSDEAA
jgi:hypothetical protein